MYDTKRRARTFGLFLMAMGVVILYLASITITDLSSAIQSTSWSTAAGRVTSSEVTKQEFTDAKSRTTAVTWSPTIEYRYTVGGQTYSGDQVWFGQFGTDDSDFATEIVQNYPEGRTIPVYFAPDDPDRSVLQPGVFLSTCIVPAIGLLLIAAGALVFWRIGLSRPPARHE